MKNVMIDVLHNVIFSRLSKGGDNVNKAPIQLSSFLMQKFKHELMSYALSVNNPLPPTITQMEEITIRKNDRDWIVRNREYRDDTNSPDVEEEMYKLLEKLL